MNVLIVYAHPAPTSFNACLRDAAADEARALGHDVVISDLYADGFGAAGGLADFTVPVNPEAFHYQSEQKAAALGGTFAAEIAREQERILGADVLILQYPLWWGGAPAILKGWLDRVCAYGITYADGTRFASGLFKGRKALLSVTTGGTPRRFSEEGDYGPIDKVLWTMQHLFLNYLGYEASEPLVSYAVARVSAEERADMLEAMRARVRAMLADPIAATPIPSSEELLASVGNRSWNSAV